MNITQGAQANLNGKVFEKMMIPVFEANGFEIFSESELNRANISEHVKTLERYVIKNASYTTIYGGTGRTEFVIVDGTRRIRVEAKYQASAGSVDEKYPYMLLNAILQYPEPEIIFVVDGGGYKAGAREWLDECINNNWLDFQATGKIIRLMKITEFLNWFNHEFANI